MHPMPTEGFFGLPDFKPLDHQGAVNWAQCRQWQHLGSLSNQRGNCTASQIPNCGADSFSGAVTWQGSMINCTHIPSEVFLLMLSAAKIVSLTDQHSSLLRCQKGKRFVSDWKLMEEQQLFHAEGGKKAPNQTGFDSQRKPHMGISWFFNNSGYGISVKDWKTIFAWYNRHHN